MTGFRRTLLAVSPPIPAEDLTVDEIAGTYLAADIEKRCLAQSGTRAYYALCTDDHHSQVDLSARALHTEPEALAAPARAAIQASLEAYSIDFDRFGQRDAGYANFVREFFAKLLAAGWLELRTVDVLYEFKTGLYPVDAGVRGSCPVCLDATRGGTCDSCGSPNSGVDLLGLDPGRYALRREPRLILDLERFRPELEHTATESALRAPAVARLTRELLERPVAPFVLSVVGARGLSLDFAGLGEQRLHPTGEMFAAQMYMFEQLTGGLRASDTLVQFAPLGRVYVHAFVYPALAAAAGHCGLDWPLPAALITTQVQQVRPSGGARSLVWARELTDVFSADAVRAYLALIGPEYTEAHFVRSVVDSSIADIAASIDRLVQLWNDERKHSGARPATPVPGDLVQCMQRTGPLGNYANARRTFNCLDHFARKLSRGDRGATAYIPSVLALALEPLCPQYVAALRLRFPAAARTWTELTRCAPDCDLPQFASRCDRMSALEPLTIAS